VILVLSVAVAALFGAGAFLVLERDLVRVVAGTLLMSQSANLFLMASGLTRGEAPILPLDDPAAVSDPLAQALTLTSVVITFGVAALLLGLVLRVHATHGTIDIGEIGSAEAEEERREDEPGGDGGGDA
jgi:multicomponent Na+:H+ antiporter subunit C